MNNLNAAKANFLEALESAYINMIHTYAEENDLDIEGMDTGSDGWNMHWEATLACLDLNQCGDDLYFELQDHAEDAAVAIFEDLANEEA